MTASTDYLVRRNRRLARQRWGAAINHDLLDTLKSFSKEFCFSISSGDLLLLDKRWYVTHVGLIRLARRNRCHGILAEPAQEFCDPKERRWAFRATVYKSRTCRGFVGYGDADPSNVSSLVRGAEMRVAETRAVNDHLFIHPGQASLPLAFCLATRRCMNLGPSFLEPSIPSYRNISQT